MAAVLATQPQRQTADVESKPYSTATTNQPQDEIPGANDDSPGSIASTTTTKQSHPPNLLVPPHFPPSHYASVTNLILICCHAIYLPCPSSPTFPLSTPHNESNWHLAPFQYSNLATYKPGEHETFLQHLSMGLSTLTTGAWARTSLLVLSGGATQPRTTTTSEARSYWHAALAQELVSGERRARHAFTRGLLLLEEHATDSFQNLLFGILAFRRATGRYPAQVRIVTHAFKARRFLELHAAALRWPGNRIRVMGLDPVMSVDERRETEEGEERHGFLPWERDRFGMGEVLKRKRMKRGWDERVLEEVEEGLEGSVKALLRWDGGEEGGGRWEREVGKLPWEETDGMVEREPGRDEGAEK